MSRGQHFQIAAKPEGVANGREEMHVNVGRYACFGGFKGNRQENHSLEGSPKKDRLVRFGSTVVEPWSLDGKAQTRNATLILVSSLHKGAQNKQLRLRSNALSDQGCLAPGKKWKKRHSFSPYPWLVVCFGALNEASPFKASTGFKSPNHPSKPPSKGYLTAFVGFKTRL